MTDIRRPQEIQSSHLNRKAHVYVRQSTEEQMEKNTGSADYQRGMAELARSWGWPAHSIEVNEEDLGRSGSAVAHRSGYQRMIAGIEAGEIGAIFLSDMSRGGRDAMELLRLFLLCSDHKVLLVVDGRVSDMGDDGTRFVNGVLALTAENENRNRRAAFERGRLAKIRAGKTVSQPPCGYVRKADGSWIKDPDPAVRNAVATVFRVAREQRSCRRMVDELNDLGVKIPRRNREGLRWKEPDVPSVYVILRNPSYMGAYHYRRTIMDPRLPRNRRGHHGARQSKPDEVIIKENIHEPYVNPEEFAEIGAMLSRNGPSRSRRNLGPGSALLQGIIRCGLHRDYAMSAHYKQPQRDGSRRHIYMCVGTYGKDGVCCGALWGCEIDRVVVAAVLDRLAPLRISVVREAVARAQADEQDEQHRRKIELHRLRQEVDNLEHRYLHVDPANRLVAEMIERRLEEAKAALQRAEKNTAVPAASTWLNAKALEELEVLAQDLSALWAAPTTENIDRKQILRTMIKFVRIEERAPERVVARILWADGAPDTMVEFPRLAYGRRRIRELADAGRTPAEIADQLEREGVRTRFGTQYTEKVIAHRLRKERYARQS